MSSATVDLLIIGGGINGVGIALDAAGRNLSVTLCEKDDLAHHTSSASSKLIHGGLRYLEQFEFKLVREALSEREVLMKMAPHLVTPLEFILPYDSHLRSRYLIRIGLFLYDLLGRRKHLRASSSLKLNADIRGNALKSQFNHGFSYMDCETDDARLVVMNAMLARDKGANILTRTKVINAVRENDLWVVELENTTTKKISTLKAKAIANATGAWVSDVLQNVSKTTHKSQIKMVKGSHFIVPKLYEGDFAYILQNPDKRIIFVIPYRKKFSLIGTTDIVYTGDPNKIDISQEEINYLLQSVSYYFKKPLTANNIVWSYSGVRALYNDEAEDPSKITREYHLEVNDQMGECPILSVFGGKLTTYRTLALHALEKLAPYFPELAHAWTDKATLPGGNFTENTFAEFLKNNLQKYPGFPPELIERYSNAYGNLTKDIVGNAATPKELGQHFGVDLYEAEVKYLIENEWAQTTDDILWRRSKLGIFLSDANVLSLKAYLSNYLG